MSWKIAFALSAAVAGLGALTEGCATDACTRADEQIAACAPPDVTVPTPSDTLACSPKRVCQADCIQKATCAEINEAQCLNQIACRPLSGTSTFAMCMAACDGQ